MASISTRSPGLMRPSLTAAVEGQRDRGGRGVGVLVDGDHHALRRQAELAADAVDDALVGLVRHEPVDVHGRQAGLARAPRHHGRDVDDRVPEDLVALHPQQAGGAGRGRAAIDIEEVVQAAVGVQRGRQHAAVGDVPSPCSALSTTAPAPSPNSTQVPRSFQSRMREKVSAPITSAVVAWPVRIMLSATEARR